MRLVFLMSLCLTNAAFAGEPYDERAIVTFDGREWVAGHANATEQEIIVEYVLAEEKPENWSELVTTMLITVGPSAEAVKFLRKYYHDNTLKACPESNWQEVFSSENTLICLWDQESCMGPKDTEYSVTGFFAGKKSVHVVTYAARDKQVFKKRAPAWIELLKRVTFFSPDESKQYLHPDLLTDTTKMIHTIYRFASASIPRNSFLSLPRKFWRSGSAYFRSEENLDTTNSLQLLMVSNSPDVWMVNLFDNTGKHIVDPGPDFGTLCPVFGEVREDGLRNLEFGKEQAFFEYYGARELADETVNSIECKVYELPRLYWVLRLYVRKDSDMPYEISRRGPDGSITAVYFDEYSKDVDFDSALFSRPENVQFTEVK